MTWMMIPKEITGDALISSSVLEPSDGEEEWIITKTYKKGECKIILSATHRRYKSLQDNNVGHLPSSPENLNVYWADDGATNRLAMFDRASNRQTVSNQPIQIVLAPRAITGLYLAGLIGNDLTVVVTDHGTGETVKRVDVRLESSRPNNAWDYRFSPFQQLSDYLLTGIEPRYNTRVSITISSPQVVKVGVCQVGHFHYIGRFKYGAKVSFRPGTVTKNNNVANVKPPPVVKDVNYECLVPMKEIKRVEDIFAEINGRTVLCIGSDLPNYQGVRAWGTANCTINYTNFNEIPVSIAVQGI